MFLFCVILASLVKQHRLFSKVLLQFVDGGFRRGLLLRSHFKTCFSGSPVLDSFCLVQCLKCVPIWLYARFVYRFRTLAFHVSKTGSIPVPCTIMLR